VKISRNEPPAWLLLIAGTLLSAFAHLALGKDSHSYTYYCPRSNSTIVGDDGAMSVSGGPYLPNARTKEDVGRLDESARRSAKLDDCSSKDFFCLRIEPENGVPAVYLAVPRVIEAGMSYRFRDIDMIAYYVTSNASVSANVQIAIWQRIDHVEIPITLTIAEGRGVVYTDGFLLWKPPALWPTGTETCVLESESGLFPNLRLLRRAKASADGIY
jgi:hypothetical protein